MDLYKFFKLRNLVDKEFEEADLEDFSLESYYNIQLTLLEELVTEYTIEIEDPDGPGGEPMPEVEPENLKVVAGGRR